MQTRVAGRGLLREDVVVMEGIVKVYPGGTVALRGVDFSLRYGEIHCLLGENGAGKTTLMKILAGSLRPDLGRVVVKGEEVRFRSPADAAKLGIGMVHQHFSLIPSFTVAENIVLGYPEEGVRQKLKLDIEVLAEEIRRFSEDVGLPVNPNALTRELPAGMKQRVEILRLLYRRADVLILDEPTSILTPLEVGELFKALRKLKAQGKTIVLVTHKPREALAIADRITVLRRGRVAARVEDPEEIDESRLAELIVGERVVTSVSKVGNLAKGVRRPALTVKDLHVLDDRGVEAVKGLDLELYEGEILGVAGVVGNGQRELVEAILGLRRPVKGRITLLGVEVTGKPVGEVVSLGLAYIPEERLLRGVSTELSVAENLVVKQYGKEPFCRRYLINVKLIKEFARGAVREYNIVAPDINSPVKFLSGGNIQRLIIARELSLNPRVVIAEQPTAGLDVKATNFVHEKLIELRNRGVAVLLISADLDEILKLSDRVAVISGGRIVKVYEGVEAIDLRELSEYMLGIRR